MPNRIIKESICVSEQIDELSPFEEIFFYRLLVNCDDYGCMDAREKVLAAKLFPLRILKPREIMSAVYRLAEIGLIGLYEVEEHPYLKVLKWSDHQRVRVSKHKYPEPTEEQLAASCGNSRQVAANCGESRQTAASRGKLRPESNPIQYESNTNPNPNPNPNPTRAGARETDTSEETFDSFWNEYPKKVAKQDAVKAWKKLKPDGELFMKIMAGLVRWKASDEWKRNDGQYIPHPATWINGKRWEDEVPVSSGRSERKVAATQYEQRDYSGQSEDMDAMLDYLAANRR